jgi:hypothetical protein
MEKLSKKFIQIFDDNAICNSYSFLNSGELCAEEAKKLAIEFVTYCAKSRVSYSWHGDQFCIPVSAIEGTPYTTISKEDLFNKFLETYEL